MCSFSREFLVMCNRYREVVLGFVLGIAFGLSLGVLIPKVHGGGSVDVRHVD